MVFVLLVVVLVLAFFLIYVYNGLVKSKTRVQNAWSQIDVQLQRRFDLIPNLVNTVQGYMRHEEKVLTEIAKLRSSWANAHTIDEKASLNTQLSGTLKTIMAVSENYPALTASHNFSELQEELSNTENKISFSRQFYNDTVAIYNMKLQVFPSNFIAGMFHFTPESFFTLEDSNARKNVKVSFDD